MPERSLVLEMRHITKRFPGIVANDDIGLDLVEGEVHALLGENGAGKSTLMNILYGLYHPDEGEILIKGKPVRLGSPNAAIDAGVGMVHQHFMTAGRGFIALAAVIFGNWRPFGAAAACLLFGFSSALAQRLPEYSDSAAVLFQALPYVLTLIAVAGVIGRSVPPAADGRPYQKQ